MWREQSKKRLYDWSELPPETLSEIATRLGFRIDIMRFRSVCKSWRRSISDLKHTSFPLTIPQPPHLQRLRYLGGRCSFLLTEVTVYAMRPNEKQLLCNGCIRNYSHHRWSLSSPSKLAMFEEACPSRFLSHTVFFWCGLQRFSETINMLDGHELMLEPIYKFHQINFVHCKEPGEVELWKRSFHPTGPISSNIVLGSVNDKEDDNRSSFDDRFYIHSLFGPFEFVDKVVLLSKNNRHLYFANDGVTKDNCSNFTIAAIEGGRVALLRLLGGDCTPDPVGWRLVHNHQYYDDETYRFDDCVDLGGTLCVLDYKGRAFLVDSETLRLTPLAKEPPPLGDYEQGFRLLQMRKRIVLVSGALFLLVPYRYLVNNNELQPRIKTYKLREETQEWVEVESLGDLTLFVGATFAFGLPAQQIFSDFESYRNCILLSRCSFMPYSNSLKDDDGDMLFKELKVLFKFGVYDLPNGAKYRVPYHSNEIHYRVPCCLLNRPLC